MHHFIIRAVGSAHEPWHPQAIHSYEQRLRPYAKIEIQEFPEGHQGSAHPDSRKTRSLEADALLKKLPASCTIIALDETGSNPDSPSFARQIDQWSEGGRPVVFLIGGSWGLDTRVKDQAHALISLGKQTLPHFLARIVLLEQLYRAETILGGKTYHK